MIAFCFSRPISPSSSLLSSAFRNGWCSQPAASSASAAGSSSFRTARANSSSRAAGAAHSIPAFDPVRTGPAASGVGSYAAAQAASEERRRLEQGTYASSSGGSGGSSGGSTRRPVSGGGTSSSPPLSKTEEAQRERRLGSGVTGSDGTGGANGGGYGGVSSSAEDSLAGSTLRLAGRDGPAMNGKSSVSGDGVLVVSSASAGSKESEGQGGEGPAVTEAVPKAQAESPVTKGVVSTTDGGYVSTVQGAHSVAAAGPGESAAAGESRRAVDKEGQHSGDDKSRERGGSEVSSLPPPPSSTTSPSTAQCSATAGGGALAGVASAKPTEAATAAAPGFGIKEDGEGAGKVVCFAGTGEKEGPASNDKPASSAPAPALQESTTDVPHLGRDDFADAKSGTGVLFQPSMPVAQGEVEEQGGFVGGGGGGEGDLSNSAYLGDMDEDELAQESDRLKRESNRAQRDAETVTEEMKEEVRVDASLHPSARYVGVLSLVMCRLCRQSACVRWAQAVGVRHGRLRVCLGFGQRLSTSPSPLEQSSSSFFVYISHCDNARPSSWPAKPRILCFEVP